MRKISDRKEKRKMKRKLLQCIPSSMLTTVVFNGQRVTRHKLSIYQKYPLDSANGFNAHPHLL